MMTSNRPDKTLELVSAAYGAAIAPERFDQLLAAWDSWCDEFLDEAETAFEAISPKFEDAISAAETLKDAAPKVAAIDAARAPMVLLDSDEEPVAMNAAAAALAEAGALDVPHLLASRRWSDIDFGGAALSAYRCNGLKGGRSYLAVEAPVSETIGAQHPAAVKMLMLSLLDWDDAFADDLRARFNLSDAELRVARGLLEGRTAQEISGALDRSVATVRSHIKALLAKSGARRQTELVQLLTILRQTGDHGASAPAVEGELRGDLRIEGWTGPAGTLSVARYGRGRRALYFTTSSLPEETQEVRAAFAAQGLEVIAPARPGFRGEARLGRDRSDALLDDWLDRLAEKAGPDALFIGHREGGIIAAKAAARLLDAGGPVGGLVLISTGAPLNDISELDDAPQTIKRSFRAARFAIAGLTLGYHTAARVFRSGMFGEERILEYFFRDSPVDAARMDDPVLRTIMRENIAYCFEDPSQIARDVAAWGADWSPNLIKVAAAAPVKFIHGGAHSFHLASRIKALAERTRSVSHLILDNTAQLALYQQPTKVAKAIAGMARAGKSD